MIAESFGCRQICSSRDLVQPLDSFFDEEGEYDCSRFSAQLCNDEVSRGTKNTQITMSHMTHTSVLQNDESVNTPNTNITFLDTLHDSQPVDCSKQSREYQIPYRAMRPLSRGGRTCCRFRFFIYTATFFVRIPSKVSQFSSISHCPSKPFPLEGKSTGTKTPWRARKSPLKISRF